MNTSVKFLIYFLVSYSSFAQNKTISLITNKSREFLCKDEKLIIRAKNVEGKAPYAFKWFRNEVEIVGENKDSLIVSIVGNYKAEMKDADGVLWFSNPINIYNFDYSQIQLSAEGDREFCTNRSTLLSAKVNVEGDNAFKWFQDGRTIGTQSSILITKAGTYALELTENQNHCAVSLPNIVVSEKGGGITAVINPNANIVIYESDSILLTSFQKDGYKYQWYKDGGQISGATKPTLYVRKSGSYVIEIKLADCVVFSSAVNISVEKPLSNESEIQPIEVLMFPNPASDKIKIDLQANVFLRELKIITQNGQEIFKTNQLSPGKQLDLRQFPRAFYEVIISTSKGSITKKLVLE